MFIQVSLIVGLEYEYGLVEWTMEFEKALFHNARLCCVLIYLLIHSEPALLCIHAFSLKSYESKVMYIFNRCVLHIASSAIKETHLRSDRVERDESS